MITPLEAGQTWLPTKPGSGWRYLCEVDGEPGAVLYRLTSGNTRRAWAWEFRDWCRRFDCFLAPESEAD